MDEQVKEVLESTLRLCQNLLEREEDAFPPVIELNVGGVFFQTTRSTLISYPESMLGAMFSGRYPLTRDRCGRFFIDRDGTYFDVVLHFLRTGKYYSVEGDIERQKLIDEVQFYQIEPLLEMIQLDSYASRFPGTTILNGDDCRVLTNWLKVVRDYKLLYKGKRDGFKASEFHERCDSQGPTLCIVQVGQYVFGGYTRVSWSKDNEFHVDNMAWIFSLQNDDNEPQKFRIKDPNKAVYHDNRNLFVFGAGHDIGITTQSDVETGSHSRLGRSYHCPEEINGAEYLAGASFFNTTDIEVYQV